MQQELLAAVDVKKASLQEELAHKLTDLQQQHVQEVLVVQGLMANHMTRIKQDAEMVGKSSMTVCMSSGLTGLCKLTAASFSTNPTEKLKS